MIDRRNLTHFQPEIHLKKGEWTFEKENYFEINANSLKLQYASLRN